MSAAFFLSQAFKNISEADMGRASIDITGQRFGRLVALRKVGHEINKAGKTFHVTWECVCDCGAVVTKSGSKLRQGRVLSCGCLAKDVTRARSITHQHSVGGKRTPEYKTYEGMLQRCYNESHQSYHHYGGRGIDVCERWKASFENFLEDMGFKPGKSYSLDRINNDLGYSKDNCRWATRKEQARNRRTNKLVLHEGRLVCAVELAKILGLPASTVYQRLASGKPLTDPHKNNGLAGKNKPGAEVTPRPGS
jgi:hypothetical protein